MVESGFIQGSFVARNSPEKRYGPYENIEKIKDFYIACEVHNKLGFACLVFSKVIFYFVVTQKKNKTKRK